ncbi:MAG: hypothetical protein ACC628_12375 [Pirellulaceae bacterium]
MPDEFNPYHQWLGLDPQLVRPNYYQLLGFNNFVSDSALISDAAERASSIVRSHRPGPYAAYWAQLLGEIETARRCLTNPEMRAAYDQLLCPAPATPAPLSAQGAPQPLADPNLYPPGQATAAPQAPQQPQPYHPAAPQPNPGVAPTGPTYQTHPQRTPANRQPVRSAPRMAISTTDRKQRSSIGPVVVGVFCLLALLGVSTSYYFISPSGNKEDTDRVVAQAPPSQTPLDPEDTGDPLEEATPGEENTSPAGQTTETPAAAVNEEEPEQTLTDSDAAAADGVHRGPELSDDSTAILEMDTPKAEPEPSQPEDPPAEPAGDEATPTSLGPLLKATCDHLRERDYDAADAKLIIADEMAASEEHKAMVSRLRLVTKYARQFHDAMHSGYKSLKANSEIEVGTGDTTNVIYVVEIRDDGVVFRVNGRNIRYKGLDKVPFGLKIAIGAQAIGMDGPRTSLRRGAYVATVSDPDDEEAISKVRSWLENAAKYVDDAKRLLTALDDSYDF